MLGKPNALGRDVAPRWLGRPGGTLADAGAANGNVATPPPASLPEAIPGHRVLAGRRPAALGSSPEAGARAPGATRGLESKGAPQGAS